MQSEGSTVFSKSVSGVIDGGVLIITIDHPPVNAASLEVRKGLLAALDYTARSPETLAVVLTGKGGNFVAGADIREMEGPILEPALPEIIARIETSGKPVVAALNGLALGGGLEIALACHSRVATHAARIGLPEVKLGIVPGAGGTQRLPRLAGIEKAARMILSASIIGAEEAQEAGIVDHIIDNRLILLATTTARELVAHKRWKKTGELPRPALRPREFDEAVKPLIARARGVNAIAEAARLVRLSATTPFSDAIAEERRTFLALRSSPQAVALRYNFFAERNAGKMPKVEGVEPKQITSAGIVGLGLMGSGIAIAMLRAGLEVVAIETDEEAVESGTNRIETILQDLIEAGRLNAVDRLKWLSRLNIETSQTLLSNTALVIEAVPDDLDLKQQLFKSFANTVGPETILATNTSYLDPHRIFEEIPNPDRCIGLHFFSPAHIMRLVEVVKLKGTSLGTLASAVHLMRRIGKLPIICNSCEGFVGNRLFSAYRRQAEFLLEEGATPKQIDNAMEAFGMAKGPFAVFDMTGLEIAWSRRKREAASRDPKARYVPIADWLCEGGRLGRRRGRGWYEYIDGVAHEDPELLGFLDAASRNRGIPRRKVADGEIVERLLSAMAIEGARLLEERIVTRASDIDFVLVNGYGFPAHQGGPMFWADNFGLAKLLRINEMRYALDGPGSEIAPLLARLVRAGTSFAGWQASGKSA